MGRNYLTELMVEGKGFVGFASNNHALFGIAGVQNMAERSILRHPAPQLRGGGGGGRMRAPPPGIWAPGGVVPSSPRTQKAPRGGVAFRSPTGNFTAQKRAAQRVTIEGDGRMSRYGLRDLLQAMPPRLERPVARRSNVEGSGTGAGVATKA